MPASKNCSVYIYMRSNSPPMLFTCLPNASEVPHMHRPVNFLEAVEHQNDSGAAKGLELAV